MSLFDAIRKVTDTMDSVLARRCDGELVTTVPDYRKQMAYIMPTSNESVVYYEDLARAEAILDYIQRARAHYGFEVDITHCLVASVGIGLHKITKMNQFISGRRLYRRNHAAVTFSVKRKRMDKRAKLSAVKLFFEEGETFDGIMKRINEQINVERSGKKTYSDKEVAMLSALPRPVLRAIMAGVKFVDFYNLLPWSFIKNDGFYTSMFIANLGSLGMNAGYHHLYEWGNCPLFMMVGKIEERVMAVDGEPKVVKVLPIHWTYDERIDDGLTSFDGIKWVRDCIEQPDKFFGELPAVPAEAEEKAG